MAGLRDEKKRNKEARIRGAALELIRRNGFAATTTAAVAKRAGIAAGTLFRYVKTKEDLLDLLFAGEIAAVVDDAFATLPKRGDIVKRLLHLFGRLYDYYQADLALARVLVAEALLPRQGARSVPLTFDFLNRVSALLAVEQKEGRLTGRDNPLALAMDCFTLYVGGVLMIVNQVGRAADARLRLERALERYFCCLRPAPPRRRKP